jgi:hypothetical protein
MRLLFILLGLLALLQTAEAVELNEGTPWEEGSQQEVVICERVEIGNHRRIPRTTTYKYIVPSEKVNIPNRQFHQALPITGDLHILHRRLLI